MRPTGSPLPIIRSSGASRACKRFSMKYRGLGKSRRERLLQEFGSLQKIQEASLERLSQVESLTQKDAQSVLNFSILPVARC